MKGGQSFTKLQFVVVLYSWMVVFRSVHRPSTFSQPEAKKEIHMQKFVHFALRESKVWLSDAKWKKGLQSRPRKWD